MTIPYTSLLVTEEISGLQDVITEIPLDVRPSETHHFSTRITEYPVEEGAKITDHVHIDPYTLDLEGFVSNTPVTSIPASLPYLKGDMRVGRQAGERAKNAYDVLVTVFRARTPLTVVTRMQTFEDMVIQKLDIPFSADRGTSLWFSMSLKKITTVETLAAALPPDVVAALKKQRAKTAASQTQAQKDLNDQKSPKTDQGAVPTEVAKDEYNAIFQQSLV